MRLVMILVVLGLFIMTGCGGVATQVRVAPSTSIPPSQGYAVALKQSYATPMDAVLRLDLGWLRSCQHERFVLLGRALEYVVAGDPSKAETLLWELRNRSDTDPPYRELVDQFLSGILASDGRWLELPKLTHLPKDERDNAITMAQAYGTAPKEVLSLPSDHTSVPFDSIGFVRTPILEIELGGKLRRFWLDTGAGLSAISSDLAEELHVLPRSQRDLVGDTSTSAKVSAKPALLPELRIGGLTIENHPVAIVDAGAMTVRLLGLITLVRVDGVLGWPFIRNLAIRIDHIHQQVTFSKPRPVAQSVRNLFWLGVPVVRLDDPQGIPLHFTIDTGTKRSHLYRSILDKEHLQIDGEKTIQVHGAGGDERIKAQIVSSFAATLGPYQIQLGNVATMPNSMGKPVRFDGCLGNDITLGGAVVIDYANGLFAIGPASP